MKKCEHCSKDCSKRVAVKHNGKVLMVGTVCSKKFKRAKAKDLLRDASLTDAIAKRTMSHGGDPSRFALSKDQFASRFKIEPDSNAVEFYNWNGYGVFLVLTKNKIKLHVYDPYSSKRGTEQVGEIIYEDVSKALTPGRRLSVARDYEYNVIGIKNPPIDINDEEKGKVLEWVDEFPSWDPIKKYGFESKYDAVPSTSNYSLKSIIKSSDSDKESSLLSDANLKKIENQTLNISFKTVKDYFYENCKISSDSSYLDDCHFDGCDLILKKSSVNSKELSSISGREIRVCKISKIEYSGILNYSISKSIFVSEMNDSIIEFCHIEDCYFGLQSVRTDMDKMKFSGCFFYFNNYFIDLNINSSEFYEISVVNDLNHLMEFKNCEFYDTSFVRCNLSRMTFINCNFRKCNFTECTLGSFNTKFINCNFSYDTFTPGWKIDTSTGIAS